MVQVNVLCAKEKGDYKDAFETFIETKLNCTVNWINTPTDLKEREKYLLLCKLNTRAPEDVECEFQTLRIESKIILKKKFHTLGICTYLYNRVK